MRSLCRRVVTALAAMATLAALLGAPPAHADGPPDPFLTEATRRLATTPDLRERLTSRYVTDRDAESVARSAWNDAVLALDRLRYVRQSLAERLAVLGADLIDARRDQAAHSTALVQLLQGTLLGIVPGTQFLVIDPSQISGLQYSAELADNAAARLKELLRRDANRINRLERDQAVTTLMLRKADTDLVAATAAVRATAERLDTAQRRLDATRVLVRSVMDARVYPGLGIRPIMLDAYLHATQAVAKADPGCGLEWWALAAVGAAESSHTNGRGIFDNGDVAEPIIGPTLDGSDDNKRIADTDGGQLDGDPVWDHAVGPMQFTPETWRVLGVDGNGDRVANVNNVYDATMTAARKLCRDREGQRLDTIDGYHTALLAYNDSEKYVTRVFKFALGLQQTDVNRSRVVNVLSGPRSSSEVTALTTALQQSGFAPSVLSNGNARAALTAITPLPTTIRDDPRPRVIAGTIVVLSDAGWSEADQITLVKGLVRDGGDLPVIWVPAPKAEVPAGVRALVEGDARFHLAPAAEVKADLGPTIATVQARFA